MATIASGDPVAAAGEITERSGWADAPTAQVASRAALVTPRDYILNAEFVLAQAARAGRGRLTASTIRPSAANNGSGARSLISGW